MLRRIFFFALISYLSFATAQTATPSWADAARKAGQSETSQVRSEALAELRREKDLDRKLVSALDTSERYLALEAISALQLKKLVPDLLSRVEKDTDGFLTLTLSSLLDEKNKDQILNRYIELVTSKKYAKLSPATIAAVLEPLGRLGMTLPQSSLKLIMKHAYPEVRSSGLIYIRSMAVSHKRRDFDKMVPQALKANEYQIRIQAISLLHETDARPLAELRGICQKEAIKKVRESCIQFLSKGGIK